MLKVYSINMHRCYWYIGVNDAVGGDNIEVDDVIIFDSVVLTRLDWTCLALIEPERQFFNES